MGEPKCYWEEALHLRGVLGDQWVRLYVCNYKCHYFTSKYYGVNVWLFNISGLFFLDALLPDVAS